MLTSVETELQKQVSAKGLVSKGAKLLDEKAPGWYNDFDEDDLNNLDITSRTRCILGCLYGDYFNGLAILSLSHMDSIGYGFMPSLHQDDIIRKRYNASLKTGWKQAIYYRRRKEKQSEVYPIDITTAYPTTITEI